MSDQEHQTRKRKFSSDASMPRLEMSAIGSKARSSKEEPVEKNEKSEARTTGGSSWAEAMESQVTLGERKKLVKGYGEFVGSSEKVVESVHEQLGLLSTCSARQKDVIVRPVREFVSELMKRQNELGNGKWERVVMRIMRENGLEKLVDLRDAVLQENLTASARNTGSKVFDNQLKSLQEKWTQEQAEFEEQLARTSREKEVLAAKLEEAWKAAEKAEETIEELEKALQKEKKMSERWKNQWESAEGEKREKQSGSKEKIQVHARRSPSRSSEGSSVDWHDEWKERKAGESFYKKGDLKNDRSEDWRVKVKNWEVKSGVSDLPEGSVRVSERKKWESDSVRSSRRSRDGSRMMVECFSKMLRASALPEPEKFDGKGDVKEFKRAFLLKYKAVTEKDADMVAILEDKFLKEDARTLFKKLKNRFNRSIDSLFKEFEEKLRKRQGDREVEALNEFEELKRKPKQQMWEFLMEMRVTKLMKALRDDPTMQKLMTMKRYEVAKKDQYEFLKDIVLQQENEDKRKQEFGKSEREEKKENSWKKEKSKDAKQEDTEAKKDGTEASSNGNISESGDQRRSSIKCYKCQGMGHIARDCDAKVIHHIETDGTGSGVGAKMREQVELLGQKRIMVIDSGAEVSVMSTRVWDALKRGCESWIRKVEVLAKPAFVVRNTSGKKMPVKGQLKIPVTVKGNEAKVWFQLQKLMEDGCGCQRRKCTVQEEDNICSSVQQLGVVLAAKAEGMDSEKWNLLKYSKEFQARVTTVEKEEALRKFAKECPEVAEAIMKEGANGEWEEAAAKIRLALNSEIKSKKTTIKETAVIISPRLKISGRNNILEVRNSHGSDFIEKYEWKDVKNVLWLWRVTKAKKVKQRIYEMIEKLDKEGLEVTMMPFNMDCVLKDVDEVTDEWRKKLKTLNNVKLIDPKKEVGKPKMPLIGTSTDTYESKESLVRYLEQAAEGHPCVRRLKEMSEEPKSKQTKSDSN
ncbi:unnamed protein product [Caenorhabditis nigoni]